MKKANHIMNPIGIIALFAGLSEASAATVLPYLDEETRQIYLWFLIAFPSALVLMFFLTLNFNSRALYAPSAFDAERYIGLFVIAREKRTGSLKSISIWHMNSTSASALHRILITCILLPNL